MQGLVRRRRYGFSGCGSLDLRSLASVIAIGELCAPVVYLSSEVSAGLMSRTAAEVARGTPSVEQDADGANCRQHDSMLFQQPREKTLNNHAIGARPHAMGLRCCDTSAWVHTPRRTPCGSCHPHMRSTPHGHGSAWKAWGQEGSDIQELLGA